MMKKALLSIVVLALALSLACKRYPDANQNAGNTSNSNTGENSNSNDNSPGFDSVKVDKSVLITINAASGGRCAIATPDPDTVYVKKNQDKIIWNVVLNCKPEEAKVVIDNFQNASDPRTKNPFGSNSDSDNTFVFEPGLGTRQKASLPATGEEAAYKYRIRVFGAKGNLLAEMDPVVIVGQ
jgi:hypothetical protein